MKKKRVKCKRCEDTGYYIPSGTMFNCEGGGDCSGDSDYPAKCKMCGKFPCPDCTDKYKPREDLIKIIE